MTYFPSAFLPSLQLLSSELKPLVIKSCLLLSLCGNSGSPPPLKPAGSFKKPIRSYSGHTIPHRKQQITAQELAWALRRRRAQVEACHERDRVQKNKKWGCENVRQLGSCQHVKSEIGMHARWCVCNLSVQAERQEIQCVQEEMWCVWGWHLVLKWKVTYKGEFAPNEDYCSALFIQK